MNGAQKATASDLISKFGATGTDNYSASVSVGGAAAAVVNTVTVDVKTQGVQVGGKDMYVSAKDGGLTDSATQANTASTRC